MGIWRRLHQKSDERSEEPSCRVNLFNRGVYMTNQNQTSDVYITQEGADFYPANVRELKRFLELAEQTAAIAYGFWGAMWLDCLYRTAPERYYLIMSENRLYSRIMEVELTAKRAYENAVREMLADGVPKDKAQEKARRFVVKSIIHDE